MFDRQEHGLIPGFEKFRSRLRTGTGLIFQERLFWLVRVGTICTNDAAACSIVSSQPAAQFYTILDRPKQPISGLIVKSCQ